MTATTKKLAIELLEKAHEDIYDADQMLGAIRITKETAECLSNIADKLLAIDRNITLAVDNLV